MSVSMTMSQGSPSSIDGIPWTSGMNVQAVMENAYGVTHYVFQLQYFGADLGYAVINVNNVPQDPPDGMYWFLYVNGQASPTGIDDTIVADGDVIGWVYQHYSELDGEGARARAHRFYQARKTTGEL